MIIAHIWLALVFGAPAPKAPVALSLKGDWVVEQYILGGREEERPKGHVFRFDGKKMTVVGKREEYEYSTEPSKSPSTIDFISVQDKDTISLGIYERDGDSLRLCYQKGKGDRPSAFESPRDSQIVL